MALMFERFTDGARRAIVWAERDAVALDHGRLGTEHLLLGIVHDRTSVGGRAFSSLISYDDARAAVAARVLPPIGEPPDQIALTATAKELLEQSVRIALQHQHARIGTGDLSLALLDASESTALSVLCDLGVDRALARTRVLDAAAEPATSASPQIVNVAPSQFELSPQTRELLRRAFSVGSSYVARRYLPAKVVSRASTTTRLLRELNASPRAEPRSSRSTLPLARAACSVCGTRSPDCGTLYTTASGLICERCAARSRDDDSL
jgi:ATP-dependent Clp protease ATP-binding subunit ClpA